MLTMLEPLTTLFVALTGVGKTHLPLDLLERALHYEEIGNDPQRISKRRKFKGSYDWRRLMVPIAHNEINILEWKNDVSVNILGLSEEKIYILKKSRFNAQRKIILVLIANDEKKLYAIINDLSRLLRSINSN